MEEIPSLRLRGAKRQCRLAEHVYALRHFSLFCFSGRRLQRASISASVDSVKTSATSRDLRGFINSDAGLINPYSYTINRSTYL
jgi:hypothetical protein